MGKRKKEKEVITRQDELDLLVDMQKTKRKYEDMISQIKERRKELDEALKEARLILKEINNVKE